MDELDHPPSPWGQVDPPALAFPFGSSFEITHRFELPNNVIGRLPRHANPARKVGWPHPVGRGKAEDGKMDGLQVGEAR